MKRSSLFVGLLALALPALAQTDEDPGFGSRFYVAPMLSYVFADKERDTDDGYGGAFAIGKGFGPAFAIEASGFYHRYSDNVPSGNGKSELAGGGLSLLVAPLSSMRSVYAIVGAAYGNTKDLPGVAEDYDSVLYSAGLGYRVQLTEHGTALRAEALYRVDDFDVEDSNGEKRFEDAVFNIGFMFPLGSPPAPPVVEDATQSAQVVSVGDDDNDGVTNEADQCPNSLPGAIVDARGCEMDEDADGVVDRLDRCPGTPPGTAVDDSGCPVVTKPACETPSAGQMISLEGCATGDTIVLKGVNFDFNKARLTPNAKTILDNVSDALAARADLKVEVGGHTDSVGSDDYNQRLSEQRADSVVLYLTEKGIDAGRLTAKGYGESQPIASNDTDEGREENRRVELKIVE